MEERHDGDHGGGANTCAGEIFTVEDLDQLPGLPGAKHELFDGRLRH